MRPPWLPHRSSLKANTFLKPRYMVQLLPHIAVFLGLISPISYDYLALNINLRYRYSVKK